MHFVCICSIYHHHSFTNWFAPNALRQDACYVNDRQTDRQTHRQTDSTDSSVENERTTERGGRKVLLTKRHIFWQRERQTISKERSEHWSVRMAGRPKRTDGRAGRQTYRQIDGQKDRLRLIVIILCLISKLMCLTCTWICELFTSNCLLDARA